MTDIEAVVVAHAELVLAVWAAAVAAAVLAARARRR